MPKRAAKVRPPTETAIRALRILAEHGPIRPSHFASLMWPESESWSRVGKCGAYGATRGVGMRLGGGGYLGRLTKKGWAVYQWGADRYRSGHVISAEGRRLLAQAPPTDPTPPAPGDPPRE